MRKRSKIVRLSAAVAALVAPGSLAVNSADATAIDPGNDSATEAKAPPKMILPVGADLMSFTVSDNSDGIVVAEHSSHASHASHSSHSSHASHASHASGM